MKAFVITIPEHEVSEQAAANCIESSKKVGNDFDIEVFDAVVPKQVNKLLRDFKIRWVHCKILTPIVRFQLTYCEIYTQTN